MNLFRRAFASAYGAEKKHSRIIPTRLCLSNLLSDFDPKAEELSDIIRVYDVSETDLRLCNDMKKERILCYKNG